MNDVDSGMRNFLLILCILGFGVILIEPIATLALWAIPAGFLTLWLLGEDRL